MKTSLFIFGLLGFLLASSASNLLAAAPVDILQDMEMGSAGELLTPAIIGASSHGATTWSISGQMWVSTKHAEVLPGPVAVDGATYARAQATRSWM